MWEIDGMVNTGRRKAPAGAAGSKKILEVHLLESLRKFIICIRKYLLFYLKLLEETGDINTLDRAYTSIRGDKRFSLCLEDLVIVALGRYLRALVSSIRSDEEVPPSGKSSSEQILNKMFSLFMEHGSLWSEVCNLPRSSAWSSLRALFMGHLNMVCLMTLETFIMWEGSNSVSRFGAIIATTKCIQPTTLHFMVYSCHSKMARNSPLAKATIYVICREQEGKLSLCNECPRICQAGYRRNVALSQSVLVDEMTL